MARAANDGKGKPVAYELFPLALLRGRDGSDLYQPLNDEAVHRITQFYDKLQEAEKTINDDIEEGEKLGRQLKIDDDIARLRTAKEGQSVQFRGNLQKGLKGGTAVVEKLFKDPPKVVPGLTALRDFHSFLIEMNFVLLPQGSRLETRLPQSDSGRDLHVLFARFHPLNEDSVTAFKIDYKEFMKLHEESKTSSADFLIVDIDLHPMYRTKEGMTKTFRSKPKEREISFPPGQTQHKGRFCTFQCPTCESTCTKELNHEDLHRISHSNMINQVFVSESKVFSIGEREYSQGESARAEICDDFCRRLGRGHTHIIRCQRDHGHDDPRVWSSVGKWCSEVLDEVTHDYYWEYFQIEDNCSESEKELFRKCDYYCDAVKVSPERRTYCQLELWHKPLQLHAARDGNWSEHDYQCEHEHSAGYHVVLVIDKSATMSFEDQWPSESSGFDVRKFGNRLGAVLETCKKFCRKRLGERRSDVLTLITFDDTATAHFVGAPMPSDISKAFKIELSWGGTDFARALREAENAIAQFESRSPANHQVIPVVIILSDGDSCDADIPSVLEAAKSLRLHRLHYPTAVLFCIHFGSDKRGKKFLQKISNKQVFRLEGIFHLESVIRNFYEKTLGQGVIGVLPSKPPSSSTPSPRRSRTPPVVDRNRLDVLKFIERNIEQAVFYGRFLDDSAKKPSGKSTSKADPDFLYAADSESRSKLRNRLIRRYFDLKSEGIGTPVWCSSFRRHMEEFVKRRISRVKDWIYVNTKAFRKDSSVTKLLQDAKINYFNPLRQFWTICKQKCQRCDLLCLKQGHHSEEHDCYTNHECEHH